MLDQMLKDALTSSIRETFRKKATAFPKEVQLKALTDFQARRPSKTETPFKVGDLVTRKPGSEDIDYKFPYIGAFGIVTAVLDTPIPNDKGEFTKMESVTVATIAGPDPDDESIPHVVEFLVDPDWLVLAKD
jgi:hypothetical protein